MDNFLKMFAALVFAMMIPQGVLAELQSYTLDPGRSKVVFYYTSGDTPVRGSFPISSAEILVDLQNIGASTVNVDVSTAGVRTGDPFALLALRGKDMLDVSKFPSARFVSRRVTRTATGAQLQGDLTLRGVTKPVSLQAVFLREPDAPTDNSELVLQITGAVSRTKFGIVGFRDLVQDQIQLQFNVHMSRTP